jgi:hypothetical protein
VQILTICVSMAVALLAVLAGVLYNNHRLNDVKELLRAEIRAAAAELRVDIQATRAEVAGLKVLIERQHSEMLLKISEIENRRVLP